VTEAHAGAREQVLAAAEAIWQRVRGTELDRVAVLESAVAALLRGRLDEDDRALAEREAHKIAGSAGTFGYARASEIARELESILAARRTDRDAAMLAGGLVKDLDAALRETAAVPPGGTVTAVGSAPMVLIMHPSAALAHAIADNARTRGLNPEIRATSRPRRPRCGRVGGRQPR
jgi:hypothetical protein